MIDPFRPPSHMALTTLWLFWAVFFATVKRFRASAEPKCCRHAKFEPSKYNSTAVSSVCCTTPPLTPCSLAACNSQPAPLQRATLQAAACNPAALRPALQPALQPSLQPAFGGRTSTHAPAKPRLQKCCINQRKVARETDCKASSLTRYLLD